MSVYRRNGGVWLMVMLPDGFPAPVRVGDTDLGGPGVAATGTTILSVAGIRRLRELAAAWRRRAGTGERRAGAGSRAPGGCGGRAGGSLPRVGACGPMRSGSGLNSGSGQARRIRGCAVIRSTRGRLMPGGRSPRPRGPRRWRCGLAARRRVVAPLLATRPRKRQ